MKKTALILAWFLASTGIILSLVVVLNTINSPTLHKIVLGQESLADNMVASSNESSPGDVKGISTSVEASDARVQIVANFLERYKSPMQPYDKYGQVLVGLADKYGFDFRLLPSIAMTESGLCKTIPPGSYNCTGYGITKTTSFTFNSYEESFEATAKSLKKNYIDKGLTNPEDIMKKYTPSSNGSWQNSVNQWMSEMRYDDHDKGLELKHNADVTQFTIASPSASPKPSSSTAPKASSTPAQ